MASSKITIKTKGDWNLNKLIANADELDGRKVIVGPKGERNRNLAKIHEYGVMIPVTDKMRGFLASKGLHLKQTTTFINIPERSFIRNGWDSNKAGLLRTITRDALRMGAGEINAEELLDRTGENVSSIIRFFARELDNPANHPFTVEQKGFNDPLIESGSMVGSIDYDKQ